ncbi:nucleoside hydrolase [Rhizobium sp. LjRoot98]|uniref:nucleoside hydrolase n=1 Tax=unclassified Rhizobium TaxID=2613769 RepID=UPI0007138751|nr:MULTISPECIES: nucleoside hydrolase [unclassified Rhizobium]KQV38983.1 nucleoside hydrolase [Rhizobium sp. Root1204]KQY16013.1 nucleoside hydrolase [Rhizobium sp. Root1334]KRC10189.1 nucleoside hydrolase [Rhizobium sp. Root73]
MHKVIFDTDPGVDDAMALLFLHNHPDIDLIGITSVFGNASIETTTRNALYLKQQWDIAAPVAKGLGETLDPSRPHVGWPTFIHGDDGLGNIGVPETVDLACDPRPAHRFIIDMVRANPGEVTLVAVGRMTNLALALRDDPDIAVLVKEVVIMGGAFDMRGNITPAAEANIHGDPEAADVVMTAPWPVVVVGLDVTEKTVMTRGRLEAIAATGGKRAKLLSDISQFYIDFYEQHVDDGMVVHDSCACVYVVAPELFTLRSGAIRVVCGGIADGQTIQKADDHIFPPSDWDNLPSQNICIGVDAEGVLDLISKTLGHNPVA